MDLIDAGVDVSLDEDDLSNDWVVSGGFVNVGRPSFKSSNSRSMTLCPGMEMGNDKEGDKSWKPPYKECAGEL